MKDMNKDYQDAIIQRVMESLQAIGLEIQEDKKIKLDEKAIKVDVLLDTMHFLTDYNENVKVLNDYWIRKRYRQKFDLDK